ncbi:ubiquitin carboxyl-terminal hydrolase 16-like isoform X1 [Ciona intestinalis]
MVKKRVKQRRINNKQNGGNIKSEKIVEYEVDKDGGGGGDAKVCEDSNEPEETLNLPPPIGLSNLGNTCFFNSVLQSLNQTPVLSTVVKLHIKQTLDKIEQEVSTSSQPTLKYTLDKLGPMTTAFSNFFDGIQVSNTMSTLNKRPTRTKSISPKNLFNQLCNKNAKFRGYQQQDSQEFFHCLLESLKQEEIKQRKGGVLHALGLYNSKAKDVSDDELKKVRGYGVQITEKTSTFVESVFGGKLISCVQCDECRMVTKVTESFVDISLPVIEEQTSRGAMHRRKGVDKDEADQQNIPKTPLSKHALKKMKKQRKQARRAKPTNHDVSDVTMGIDDAVGTLANHVAEMVLSDAMMSLKLFHEEDVLQVRGGSIDVTSLNIPEEEEESPEEPSEEDQLDETTSDKDSTEDEMLKPTRNQKVNSLFDTPMKKVTPKKSRQIPDLLGHRFQPASEECSVQSCFHQFTKPEILTGSNKFGCEVCTNKQKSTDGSKKTVYCNASKQMLIKKPPVILAVHLKRFQQAGFNLRKVNKKVEIPIVLDLSPFSTVDCQTYADSESRLLYELYAIVEHSGSLSRGHYTAYVKLKPTNDNLIKFINKEDIMPDKDTEPSKGVWYHTSDTNVSKTTQAKALNCNAYMLFYERII